MSVSIEVDDKAVRNALNRLAGVGAELEPAIMRDIGDMMVSRITEGFDQGEAPDGEKWEPLTKATKRGRLRRNRSNFRKNGKLSAKGKRAAATGFQTLVDTGNLRNSITRNVGENKVEVGTDIIYGTTHQFGSEEGAIPARPFMPMDGLPQEWTDEAVGIIANHIAKALK